MRKRLRIFRNEKWSFLGVESRSYADIQKLIYKRHRQNRTNSKKNDKKNRDVAKNAENLQFLGK